MRASAPVRVVVPAAGSRLEQLHAAYGPLKAAADDAAARFEACKEAIKAEAQASAPGSRDYLVAAAPGLPALRVSWRTAWQLDTKKLKAERPLIYVQYAEQKGRWELREAR